MLGRLSRYLGQYTIVTGPPAHASDTSTVVFAKDALQHDRKVAIKIGENKGDFKSLMRAQKLIRKYLALCKRTDQRHAANLKHRETDLRKVMCVVKAYWNITELTVLEFDEHGSTKRTRAIQKADTDLSNLSYEHKDMLTGNYVTIMPRADTTLAQSFASELCKLQKQDLQVRCIAPVWLKADLTHNILQTLKQTLVVI